MKKFSFLLTVVVLLLCFNSCVDEPSLSGKIISTSFFVKFINTNGENILTSNSFIEIFYDKDGEVIKVDRPYLENRYGYRMANLSEIGKGEATELYIEVYASDFYYDNNFSKTYIKLDNYGIDTFICEFTKSNTITATKRIWLNNELVLDDQNNISGMNIIQVIK